MRAIRRITVVAVVSFIALGIITTCGRKGPDTTLPNVTASTPAAGAVGVAVNISPSVTFNMPVDANTISFVLSSGTTTVPCAMSYSGTTAIFTPASPLEYNQPYLAIVRAGVRNLDGNAMQDDYAWSFMTGAAPDTTPPSVVATTPENGANGVVPNAAVSVTFSESVDEKTISYAVVSSSTGTVPCTMSYSGTTAIFTPPAPLAYNTQYTVTVKAGVKDLAGNAMPNDHVWSFMTGTVPDTTPPGVTGTTPSAAAAGVAVNISPNITFSEPVNEKTISFVLSAGTATVPCTMSYSGTTAIFTPSNVLSRNTLYTATVMAGVKDLAGNAMTTDYNWPFTTGAASDTTPPGVTATTPANGATASPPNAAVNVTFSEPVDEKTISFVLSAGTATVPCTMSYSGTTAIFTPSNVLSNNTLYTATVRAGVKDLAGNAMLNDYNWTFTTGETPDTTPPGVTASTPSAGATGVTVNMAPSVTFSEPVNEKTIAFILSAGTAIVPCTMSYSGTTAIFTPSSPLSYGIMYTATVSAGVKDLAGNAMPNDYSWSFTTTVPTYTITASAGANGSISPSGSVPISQSATQSFTISPNPGYHIADVIVDGASVGPVTTYTFPNVTANHTIAASFSINTYTVTPSVSGGNGTISPSTAQTVNYNGTTAFTVTPNTGYSAVMGGTCGGTLSGNTYTTNSITANCTVTASFSANPYTLTVAKSGTGTGIITASTGTLAWNGNTGTATYSNGTPVTLTASPDVSSTFTNWIGCDSVNGAQCTVNMNAEKNVTATFAINTLTITASAGANGSISPSGSTVVNYGATPTYTFYPNAGYYVSAVTVDSKPVSLTGQNSYTFPPVTTNHIITVSFSNITHIITASVISAGTGTIDPYGQVLVVDGANKTFTITPATGYRIVDVQADGTSVGVVTAYTFTKITTDHSISASFTIKATATVTLSNLSWTYDGTPKSATATTTPAGLNVTFTYNGSATAPSVAGSYTVVGTVNDANYQGSASGTLTIAKATPVISWSNPAAITYGTPLSSAQLNATSSVQGSFAYTPAAGTVLNAGTQTLSVTFTPTDTTDYNTATASVQITVSTATATVTLGSLSQTYDGTPKSATATTTPAGLNVTFTYNGSATAPSAAGSYTVVGTINDTNYQGSATDTLVIAKATATVTLGSLSQTYDGTPKSATATTNPPGLAVTFTYNGGATAPSAAGSYTVVGTVNDTNYQGNATGMMTVSKANQTITFGPLPTVTVGDPPLTLGATSSSGLTVTYSSSNTAVATVSGNSVVILGAGTTTITASQLGDANYNPAADVAQNLIVNEIP